MKKSILSFILLAFSTSPMLAANAPVHSKVVVSNSREPNGEIKFEFKVVPNSGLKITADAPWKLQIKEANGLKFATSELDRNKLDEALPGFKISAEKPSVAEGKIAFKLVSFICTENKTQCYREVHEDNFSWK